MGILDAPMQYDKSGLYIPRSVRSRSAPAYHTMFQEDFSSWPLGMWNDGTGDVYRDCDVMFAGKPTARLSLNNETNGSQTNPNRTPITTGVVFKRRLHDAFTGIFGVEMWFRMTSTNNNGTGNPLLSMSVYNRTGTDTDGDSTMHCGRIWLDQNGNNKDMILHVLDGAQSQAQNTAVWAQVDISGKQTGAGQHNYDPSATSGRNDRAGGWHYAYFAVDLKNSKYVEAQIDGNPKVNLSSYQTDLTASTGAAMMHFSVEYSANTSTYRWINIAQVTGYGWS